MLINRLKECGSMLRVLDMCQMFDRCLILVKKSETVYNIMETRTPPHASRAHPYNYTTSQTCCTCQTFDRQAAGLLQMCNMCDICATLSVSFYLFFLLTMFNSPKKLTDSLWHFSGTLTHKTSQTRF